jgi:hypothetical protein
MLGRNQREEGSRARINMNFGIPELLSNKAGKGVKS